MKVQNLRKIVIGEIWQYIHAKSPRDASPQSSIYFHVHFLGKYKSHLVLIVRRQLCASLTNQRLSSIQSPPYVIGRSGQSSNYLVFQVRCLLSMNATRTGIHCWIATMDTRSPIKAIGMYGANCFHSEEEPCQRWSLRCHFAPLPPLALME